MIRGNINLFSRKVKEKGHYLLSGRISSINRGKCSTGYELSGLRICVSDVYWADFTAMLKQWKYRLAGDDSIFKGILWRRAP